MTIESLEAIGGVLMMITGIGFALSTEGTRGAKNQTLGTLCIMCMCIAAGLFALAVAPTVVQILEN
jgi:hypothetical protein